MTKAWFQTGEAGVARAGQIQEERAKGFGPRRFFLGVGKSGKVTFLDSVGFFFYEHNLKIDGRWGHFYTCLKDFSECPLCDMPEARPAYVAAYTIIDHTEWEDKTGKVWKNQKKLLVAKGNVIPKLSRKCKQAGGDLTYSLLLFSRDGKQECSTGEDIEFLKKLSREDVLKFKPADQTDDDFLKPFDYVSIFAPKTVEELRRIAGATNVVGAEPGNPSTTGGNGYDMPAPAGAETVGSDADIDALL